MILLRSAVFQLLFYCWMALLAVLYLPFLVLPRKALVHGARFWTASSLRLLGWTTGLVSRIEGAGHRPAGPAIYAAKHQSTWDTLAITGLLPDPAIVVKRELLWIPFFGWYLRRVGGIGIDRAAGAAALRGLLRDARRAVEQGRDIFVFPEGTRTAPGERRPYHSGIAALYRDLGLPVVPIALNSGLFWRRRSFTKRPGTITMRLLEPIPPGLDRKTFMERLEAAIEGETETLCQNGAGAAVAAAST